MAKISRPRPWPLRGDFLTASTKAEISPSLDATGDVLVSGLITGLDELVLVFFNPVIVLVRKPNIARITPPPAYDARTQVPMQPFRILCDFNLSRWLLMQNW